MNNVYPSPFFVGQAHRLPDFSKHGNRERLPYNQNMMTSSESSAAHGGTR